MAFLIIRALKLCIIFYALEKTMAENYPLILIKVGEVLIPPDRVENIDGKEVFSSKSGGDVTYWCPATEPNMAIKEYWNPKEGKELDEYCLLPTELTNSDRKLCPRKAEPFINNLFDYGDDSRNLITCRLGEEEGTLHQLIFLLCYVSEGYPIEKYVPQREEIFRFCYSPIRNTILYTRHKIFSSAILRNVNISEELINYSSDNISTDGGDYFTDGQFERMKQEIEYNGLKAHMSVPLGDFALGIHKESLLHYANVIGMPPEISLLWNFIDKQIQNAAIKLDTDFIIHMGTFPSVQGTFWCKIVFVEEIRHSVAIIVHEVNPTFVQSEVLKGCDQRNANCKFEKWEGFETVSAYTKLAHCCKVDADKIHLFGSEIQNMYERDYQYLDLNKFKNPNNRSGWSLWG